MRKWINIIVEQTAPDIMSNPAFRHWFGNSKVVDRLGHPLIVYHGTGHEFTAFDPESEPYTYEHDRGKFFFTTSREIAAEYAATGDSWGAVVHKNPRIIAAYISLQNPYVIDNSDDPINDWDQWGHLYAKDAETDGNDGIIIHTEDASEWLVIAFRPEQIKEITNTKFDPNSPHMHE